MSREVSPKRRCKIAMPEFLDNIQQAAKDPTGWLSPHTVADLLEIDFHTM